jgi:hypothetical protein
LPDIAHRLHELLAAVLDSPAGRTAQIGVASHILRADEHLQLATAVREHITPLLRLVSTP